MVTIGVAVAIPEPWATQLQDYRTSVGDTTATQIPTHITLIPPVVVPADELPVVETHLERAASAGRNRAAMRRPKKDAHGYCDRGGASTRRIRLDRRGAGP